MAEFSDDRLLVKIKEKKPFQKFNNIEAILQERGFFDSEVINAASTIENPEVKIHTIFPPFTLRQSRG